jgi:acetyl-CoA synthetase
VGTSTEFTPEEMDAEDPLFILYTSGSTGDPKGLVHTTGGYLVDAMLTFKWVFDYHDGDVFWSTADFGWITGHTYGPYGPLLNGATIVMLEGAPTYPSPSRIWNIVDEYKVTLLYTSPTALRTFRAEGDGYLKGTSRESLRVLGSVGEPIDPDLWEWYHRVVGGGRCPIVDTWWQTETGAHMITLLPGAMPQKPGVASKPFFGRAPVIIDKDTKELLSGACEGILCFQQPWPGMARDIWGNHARYLKTYFNEYPGYYFTGDGCRRDLDSYYKITGRVDDDFKVSAHRFSSEQIESACASHEAVVKSGVVGCPDERTGQGIYIFAVLKKGWEGDDALRQALANHIRIVIGKIAKAKEIQFVTGLPETRSGKTMRAILRKIVYGESIDVSEYPTLVNPSVVPSLIEGWKDLQLPRRKGIKVQGLPAKDQLKL